MFSIPSPGPASDFREQGPWTRIEMEDHSHGKTEGYEEKERRMKRKPAEDESTMGFANRYWWPFHKFAAKVSSRGDQRAAPQALQQLGKLNTVLTDRVGMLLWLIEGRRKYIYAKEAANIVVEASIQAIGASTPFDYDHEFRIPRIEDTAMGDGLTQLHEAFVPEDVDLEGAIDLATMTAVRGMFTWHAYRDHLRGMGINPLLPQPGLPSGEIQPWQDFLL